MACAEFESRLLEYSELTGDAHAQVDAHLARCPDCREFFEALAAIDAALGEQFTGRKASAGFEQAVRERVRSERRAGRPSCIPEVLDFVGWGTVAAIIGLALYWMSTTIPAVRENAEAFRGNATWAAAAVFVAISFLIGIRSIAQLKR